MRLTKKIEFTNFNSVSDMTPKKQEETISQFITHFENPKIKNRSLKQYQLLSKADKKAEKNGSCFSLATFGNHIPENKKSLRTEENVVAITGIGIDVDNDKDALILTAEAIKTLLGDWFYIIHSTHSSTQKQPRFRVIFLFDKPVTPSRFNAIVAYFYAQLGGKNDTTTKDPCRLFFYPSCPSDQEEYYYFDVNKGALFDTSIPKNLAVTKNKPTTKKAAANTQTVSIMPVANAIDLASLPIKSSLKKLIENGYKNKRFPSRSEYTFYCIAELLNDGIADETIFNIVSDKQNTVSQHYKSDAAVWKDIERIKSKIEKKIYGVIIGTEPYYKKPIYQDPDKICTGMAEAIATYIDDQQRVCTYTLGIKAPAGVGKTAVVIDKIITMTHKKSLIEVYLPTHKLAKEFKKRILKSNTNRAKEIINADVVVEIIYGRTSPEAPEKHCTKKSSARALSGAGGSVSSLLCKNKDSTEFCSDYDSCNYRAQFTRKRTVVIYTHTHLFLERNADEKQKKPDLIVIDESFFQAALASTPITDINALTVPDLIKESLLKKYPYKFLQKAIQGPTQDKRFSYDLGSHVKGELAALKKQQNALFCSITPLTLPQKATQISSKASEFLDGIALLETMVADCERIENGKEPLFLYLKEDNASRSTSDSANETPIWYCVKQRKEVVRTSWGKKGEKELLIPTVYLDADLDRVIAKQFFDNIKIKKYAAERYAKIWQLASITNAKATFYSQDSDRVIKRAQAKITKVCNSFFDDYEEGDGTPNVLVVTYKKLLDDEKFTLPENCEAIYFGNLRGIDKFKHFDACVVIGRFQIPHDAVDRYGISLWHDDEEALLLKKYAIEKIGYRITSKKKLGIPVSLPVDLRLQAVTRQLRECETLQAIDRLRLIHNKKANNAKKTVLILSNVPLDIDVDQIMFTRRSIHKINRIIRDKENPVITLHAQTFYDSHGSDFKSIADAKKVISRWSDLYLNDDNIASVGGREIRRRKYSFNNKSGAKSHCLHRKNLSDADIIDALKKIHNTTIIKLVD